MKRFKQFLLEKIQPQWTSKTQDYVFGFRGQHDRGMIPLSKKMLERIFGKVDRQKVFHVVGDFRTYKALRELEGTKKSISSFTKMTYSNFMSGIWGGGGILVELEGDVLAGGEDDIMSMPDRQGRRWLRASYLVTLGLDESLLDKIIDEIEDMRFNLIEREAKQNENVQYFLRDAIINAKETRQKKGNSINMQELYKELSQQEKKKIIKGYYDEIENILKKYTKELQNTLNKARYLTDKVPGIPSGKFTDWNELVVNNIKIKNVYFDETLFDFEYRVTDIENLLNWQFGSSVINQKNVIKGQSDYEKILMGKR